MQVWLLPILIAILGRLAFQTYKLLKGAPRIKDLIDRAGILKSSKYWDGENTLHAYFLDRINQKFEKSRPKLSEGFKLKKGAVRELYREISQSIQLLTDAEIKAATQNSRPYLQFLENLIQDKNEPKRLSMLFPILFKSTSGKLLVHLLQFSENSVSLSHLGTALSWTLYLNDELGILPEIQDAFLDLLMQPKCSEFLHFVRVLISPAVMRAEIRNRLIQVGAVPGREPPLPLRNACNRLHAFLKTDDDFSRAIADDLLIIAPTCALALCFPID